MRIEELEALCDSTDGTVGQESFNHDEDSVSNW